MLNEIAPVQDDLFYLKKAYEFAAKYSTDPSTQNGAVIVTAEGYCPSTRPKFAQEFEEKYPGSMTLISYQPAMCYGANHFPRNVKEFAERWERPLKYQYVEHAERNAIYTAAKDGFRTQGSTMYCPWFACSDCGRAIIQAGIKEVVGHKWSLHESSPHWKESIAIAMQMLEEAGVKCRYIEGKIFENDEVKIRFNGKLECP